MSSPEAPIPQPIPPMSASRTSAVVGDHDEDDYPRDDDDHGRVH